MGNMHMLYAHQSTMTFRLERLTPLPLWTALKEDFTYKVLVYHVPSGAVVPVPLSFLVRNGILYRGRGWCRAEIEWSATRGIQQKNLAVDGEPGERGRMKKVPMAPAMFQRHMDTAAFTHRDDSKNVVQLQKKIFYDKVTARKQLNLMDLSEADMIELTASLLHFKELKVLRINIFSAGKAEATAFFQALKPLTLEKLRFTSTGSISLLWASRHCSKLKNASRRTEMLPRLLQRLQKFLQREKQDARAEKQDARAIDLDVRAYRTTHCVKCSQLQTFYSLM
eukprot:g13469.t1